MEIALLVLFAAFSSSQQDIQLATRPEVWGTLGERVSLPCWIVDGQSAVALTITWTKDGGVAVYTRGVAAAGFEGRASLDQSRLDSGDISLLLSDSTPPDEGNYTCQVGTASGRVELKLGRLGSRPRLVVDSVRSGRSLSLSCRSRGWYPAPVVSWSSSDGQALSGAPLDSEGEGDGVLWDVREGVTLRVQGMLNITCTVRNPVLRTQCEEVLNITGDFPPDASPWLLAFWGVSPLVALAAGIMGYFFKRKRDSVKEKERQAREAEREPLTKQDEYAELKKELSGARAVSNSEWKRVLRCRTKIFSLAPGSEGPEFCSGSHYWEVILGDLGRWTVGVKTEEAVLGRDSFPEKGVWSFSRSPEKGYCVWLRPPLSITPSSQPKRVGVLLDYDDGQLTLYDPGTKPPQRLYTISAVFTSPVRPFYR